MEVFLYWVFLRVADTCITLIALPECTPSPPVSMAIEPPSSSPISGASTPGIEDQTTKSRSKTHDDGLFRFARDLSLGLAAAFAADDYEALRITIRGAHMCIGFWGSSWAVEAMMGSLIPRGMAGQGVQPTCRKSSLDCLLIQEMGARRSCLEEFKAPRHKKGVL